MSNEIQQGSAEWLQMRAGRLTASRLEKILTGPRGGQNYGRDALRSLIVAEIVTGTPQDPPLNSPAVLWGTQNEPEAREAYQEWSGLPVAQVAFVEHPTIGSAGASPDGLVGEDGNLEIKCPTSPTHLETVFSRAMPVKHMPQVQWQMACTGRRWTDFVSYDPRVPRELQLFVVRVPRNEAYIAKIEADARAFLDEVFERVREIYNYKLKRNT